jgi:hypothetical protein
MNFMKVIERESKNYDLMAEDGTFLGTLEFQGWFESKASITTQFGEFYDLVTVGFWTSKVEVRIGGDLFAELKRNWMGQVIIDIMGNDIEKDFIVKPKGFWRNRYVLQDRFENDIITLLPNYEWFGKTHYSIEINPEFQSQANETMILLAIYGAVSIKKQQQAAAAGA